MRMKRREISTSVQTKETLSSPVPTMAGDSGNILFSSAYDGWGFR
jgi:hypothetical protein